MRRLGPALLMLALSASFLSASAYGAERRTIPAGYIGDWASAAERCAPGPANNENIRIGARFIQEFESRLDVRTVIKTQNGGLLVGGKYKLGDVVYDNAIRLVLLEDGRELGFGEGEDYGTYVRCKR